MTCSRSAGYDLLIINEWLPFPISVEEAQILLSLIDRRHKHQTAIIAPLNFGVMSH